MTDIMLEIFKCKPKGIPKHYSSHMKKLIDSMLQINPASRPNINNILKYPAIMDHVK